MLAASLSSEFRLAACGGAGKLALMTATSLRLNVL